MLRKMKQDCRLQIPYPINATAHCQKRHFYEQSSEESNRQSGGLENHANGPRKPANVLLKELSVSSTFFKTFVP